MFIHEENDLSIYKLWTLEPPVPLWKINQDSFILPFSPRTRSVGEPGPFRHEGCSWQTVVSCILMVDVSVRISIWSSTLVARQHTVSIKEETSGLLSYYISLHQIEVSNSRAPKSFFLAISKESAKRNYIPKNDGIYNTAFT